MEEEIKNIGFDLAKELAEQSDEDIQVGGDTPEGIATEVDMLVVAGYAWTIPVNGIYQRTMNQINHAFTVISEFAKKWLPLGQIQQGRQDWMNCATNAPVNSYESKFNFAIANGLFSDEFVSWLKKVGYINPSNGKFEASNAFNSILSGTTQSGNSLKAPLQSITNHGLIPLSMLPDDKSMTWAQYHNTNRVTQEMRDLGKELLRRLYPENPERALMYAQAPYSNFSTITKGLKWDAFDSYQDTDGDHIKRLAADYNFLNYGYKTIINHLKKNEPPKEEQGETMTFFKASENPHPERIYQLGKGSGKYHWIADAPTYFDLYGDFSNNTIKDLKVIPQEQIGRPVGQPSSFADIINNFFKGLTGK